MYKFINLNLISFAILNYIYIVIPVPKLFSLTRYFTLYVI